MAYAAVISLKHTIQRLNNSCNPQITKAVYEEVKFLEDFLKRLDASSNRSVINALDARIREAVCELEDMLQSYVLYHYLPPSESLVKQKIDSFTETVRELRWEYDRELQNPLSGEEDAAIPPIYDDFGGSKSTMVGLSKQFETIREELLDRQSGLKTISLFGMAGSGKTHLARNIYHLPITIENFHSRVWVKLGPKHHIKNVLVDIVAQIERRPRTLYMEEDESALGLHIYKKLCGRKYFIVLDDIWSIQAWDELKMWFPSETPGGRLLLTTRLEEVANYPAKCCIHQVRLLKHEESWNLFCKNVFGDGICPPQLEKAASKIVDHCEGLPLLILQVSDLLSRSEKSIEHWNSVASKQDELFINAFHEISEVLLLSFEYLPQYLKACFLYLGAFPENCEIPLPKLINLWTVEDFLEPNQSQAIEDFAFECLNMLVSQSLVIICKLSSNGKIKSFKLHSTYWHLCVIEASKNKFLHVRSYYGIGYDENMESQRRLSIQNNVLFGIREVHDSMVAALRSRSLLCTGQYLQYEVPICLNLMLLKVFDALAIRFYEFPIEVLELLQLKYLALTHDGNIPFSISKLQYLQSLIVGQHHNVKYRRDSTSLPKEIWDMQELRYLRIMGRNLPEPSSGALLPNLLTLHVDAHSCTRDVFRSIPKLKKLGIKIELQPRSNEILNCFEHISMLSELESLKCVVVNPRLRSQVVAPPIPHSSFPDGLKKLSLNGIGYSWEYMSEIGSLPNLQVLKLRRSAFRGSEWETKVEHFSKLQFLLLEDIDLVHWTIDDDECFPSLRRLIIRHCYNLKEIPSQIGPILTLETIEVVDCMPSVVDSVLQIKEEEEEYGNYSLQVPISSSYNL